MILIIYFFLYLVHERKKQIVPIPALIIRKISQRTRRKPKIPNRVNPPTRKPKIPNHANRTLIRKKTIKFPNVHPVHSLSKEKGFSVPPTQLNITISIKLLIKYTTRK